MPICTYLDRDDHLGPTSDSEINTLVADVRKMTGEDWRVHEITFWTGIREHKRYAIYHETKAPEYQMVNLYRPDRPEFDSVNTINEASHVAAYLYGVLAGMQSSTAAQRQE